MSSKLLQLKLHEAENQLEHTLLDSFQLLKPQLKPPFPLTIPTPSQYSNLNQAILYAILTQPLSFKTHITHLHAIITDGYEYFTSLVSKLVFETYPRLNESVKVQLLSVVRVLVDVSGVGVDGLVVLLMRSIVVGDFSDGNLWLCVELVRIFLDYWDWVLEEWLVLTSGLFTFLRVLSDHCKLSGAKYEALKRMEIDFCVRVIRNHFSLCLRIGRELVRILQDLVCVPEFKDIWKDLLLNPSVFGVDGFSDISQLYCLRTSSRYLLLRITPEMETQLRFLLTHVQWGFQKRYQAWFAKKFFYRPEGETVISDIVRFICCAHHPPNEIIQSNVISRWAIIGWLLTCCRNSHVEANTKLALFYDWMFYNERVDNIMNIEPGMLLMVNSIPTYIDITKNLLEFLLHLVDIYDVQRKDVIVRGVSTTFGVLVKKGVVHSLEVFSSCTLLSPLLKEKLANICSKSALAMRLPHHPLPPPSLPGPSNLEKQTSVSKKPPMVPKGNGMKTISSVLKIPVASHTPPVIHDKNPINIMEDLVRRLGESKKHSKDSGLQILEELLFSYANHGIQSLDSATSANSFLRPEALASQVTKAFCSNGYDMFAPLKSLAQFNSDDEIQSATALVICTYIFSQNKRIQELVLFWSKNGYLVGPRILSYASRLAYEAHKIDRSGTPKDENNFSGISSSETLLLKHHIDKYVSFMTIRGKGSANVIPPASKIDSKQVIELIRGAFTSYRSFLMSCNLEKDTSLDKILISDLMSCCEWEKKRLKEILCNIFSFVPDLSTGKDEFIRLLLEMLDYADIVALQFEICLKSFAIFGEDTDLVSHIIKNSLSWGFVEQQKLWALIGSEQAISKVKVENVVTDFFCLGDFDPNVHSIAVGGLFTLCCRRAPTPELVSTILSLPDNTFETFTASVLANWVVSDGSMLFSSLAKCLDKFDKTGVRINQSSISRFSDFLDKQGKQYTSCLNKLSVSIPKIRAKLANAVAAAQKKADDIPVKRR
ncbi:hypothetical protein IFM89_013908 [Coptis chinensis]|uniref:Integrator complex subunit 3 n=1 Tax=Coptis chinensis TaxID=261450 RepID=A0A835LJ85_9MAGN|nr:hypothetical protein IFM89_013908 [Coptis chinensis]